MKLNSQMLLSASLALMLSAPAFATDGERARADSDAGQPSLAAGTSNPNTGADTDLKSSHGDHHSAADMAATEQQADAANEDLEPIEPKEFVETASAKGMAEIETAKIALEKATMPEVREYAERMIKDHKKANSKLEKLAKQQGLKPSKDAPLMDKAKAEILEMRDGESFDEAYINNQVVAHEQTIELFERAVQSEDKSIRSYAQETLPVLRHHMEEIKELQNKVGETS